MTLAEFLIARIDDDEASAPYVYAEQFTPARVLAECEAKRRIMERCRASNGYWGYDIERLLALPYADHPDYREEWKP